MEHFGSPPNVPRETLPDQARTDVSDDRSRALDRLGHWLGIDISPQQRLLLEQFEGWLVTEAQAGGGLGPREHLRVFDRHIADSLAFLRGLSGTPDPERLVDVGSGVGLPGIPLAILLPTTHVTLLDRSGRRVELARRATRVLGLHNVETVQADVNAVDQVFDVVTFRASLPIVEATTAFLSCSSPGGIGLVGVSRRDAAPQIPEHPAGVGYALTAEGRGVLDSPFWLLRMQRI